MVDVALQGSGISIAEQVDRAKVLQRLRLGDVAFRHLTRAAAVTVLVILGGIIISLVWGSLPALRAFGVSFLYEEVWNPVTEKFGAIAPIYGTVMTSFIAMLIAVPVGLFIALFLTELCPHVVAASDRHRHRAARRHSQHHLRHLGPVRIRAVPPAICAAVPDHGIRPSTGVVDFVRRAALWHRHFHCRPDPGNHGATLHHIDFAGCVRGSAAGAQGGGLRPRLHDLGGRALRRAALYARRCDRRRHARPRPRAWRNHGGHLRDRQCAPHFGLFACARHHHFRNHRQ